MSYIPNFELPKFDLSKYYKFLETEIHFKSIKAELALKYDQSMFEPLMFEPLMTKLELKEQNPFVRAMKKVWETVKWLFEKIAQFFVDAWHKLFEPSNPKELSKDTTPHPLKDKIKMAVKEILMGKGATFTASEHTMPHSYPLPLFGSVRDKLIEKGFENKIALNSLHAILAKETTDWHTLSLDSSKFSKDEIIRLAIQQIKKHGKIVFYGDEHKSPCAYRMEFAEEVKSKLIAEGYKIKQKESSDFDFPAKVTLSIIGKN